MRANRAAHSDARVRRCLAAVIGRAPLASTLDGHPMELARG